MKDHRRLYVDTSALHALVVAGDINHKVAVEQLKKASAQLVHPVCPYPALFELHHALLSAEGLRLEGRWNIQHLISMVVSAIHIEMPEAEDIKVASTLIDHFYEYSRNISVASATILAMSQRENVPVLTFDRDTEAALHLAGTGPWMPTLNPLFLLLPDQHSD